MTQLIRLLLLSLVLANAAGAQIVVVNPGDRPTNPPIEPPGRQPITVRPDPTRIGGGDFDGHFYEYCGPASLGYKCNLMRSEGVAKMRDESVAYKDKNVAGHQKTLDGETAKVDKDLDALREGLVKPDSPAGVNIKSKRDAASAHNTNAATLDDSTFKDQRTASTQIDSSVDISFGLAYKEGDKKDYQPEARKVNLVVAERFIAPKIDTERARADAIEAQIKNGVYSNKADRLAMVNSGRAALEISAQSLQQGEVSKSNFALEVGTVLLDTAISVTPILGWAKDGWEACTGRNLLTGKKLSGFERTMAVVGVLSAGIGSKLAIAGKAAVLIDVLRAGKVTEEAAEVARAVSKGAEIAEAAAKVGIKEKSVIDEVAAAVKEGFPCSVAMNPIRNFFIKIFEDVAYAADCVPGSVENAIVDALDEAGPIIKNLTPKKVIAYLENVENVPKPQLVDDMKSIGLKVKGSSPDGRFMEFMDSESRLRAKIHPADKVTSYDHLHIYDKNGNALDKVLNIVSGKSSDAHIPISGG